MGGIAFRHASALGINNADAVLLASPIDADKPTGLITHFFHLQCWLVGHRDLPSIPVLALSAQTSYRTSVAAVLPGHMSYPMLRAQVGIGASPAESARHQSTNRPAFERREGYRVGKGRA
jgi:hypothetical protein